MKTFNEILLKNRNENELKSHYQKLLDDVIIENSAEEYKNQFLQPDVSINEGLQSENKKVPEVTVLPADSYSENQVINILGRYTSYVYDNRNKMGGLSVYYPFAKDWFNKNVKAGKTGC